jgi:hypothetical protein
MLSGKLSDGNVFCFVDRGSTSCHFHDTTQEAGVIIACAAIVTHANRNMFKNHEAAFMFEGFTPDNFFGDGSIAIFALIPIHS